MVDIPMEISYEIICALERSPPSNEYLLFDAQPAITMPYTPSEAIAMVYINPTGIGASAMSSVPHFDTHGAANGMTTHVSSAAVKEMAGARMKSGRYAWPG